jgi:hypothetical protein
MNNETTLGLAAGGDGHPAKVAEHARKVARTAAETDSNLLAWQIEALGTFAAGIWPKKEGGSHTNTSYTGIVSLITSEGEGP